MFLEYTENVDLLFPTDALFYVIGVSPHVVCKTADIYFNSKDGSMPSGLSDS
jgi:hypothetical protein